jgi:hypothetical protein|tara:strand:- start:54 stop:254 length:201 start_codon:yes stop_codon:yes gene_type:complete
MNKVEVFKDLIDHYRYKEAAKMYFDLAYTHQDAFNKILNEKGDNVKNKVIDIMYNFPGVGDYTDQK